VTVRYRGPGVGSLRTVPLDPLTAVYHRASGITHLLASPAPELLEAMGDDWLDADALMERLSRHFDLGDGDVASLRARLDELVAAGLVEAR
jgi:PqqD family protein of HPr-rel-A system